MVVLAVAVALSLSLGLGLFIINVESKAVDSWDKVWRRDCSQLVRGRGLVLVGHLLVVDVKSKAYGIRGKAQRCSCNHRGISELGSTRLATGEEGVI
jgi:hypothetical protein